MAKYRKLGRTSNQRKALLRNQVTQLLYHGKIRTTEAKAKEIRKIAEGLIALGVKEKDNFEVVKVQAKVAKKDAEGKRVKEVVDGKKVTVYETVEKEIKAGLEKTNDVAAASAVGTAIAKKALDKGITEVVFDRGGFIYQGKIKALAEAAREAGLQF
mgnify:CR=1 FL=1